MQSIQLFGSILRLFGYFILAGVVTNFLIPVIGHYSLEQVTNIDFIRQHPKLFYTFTISDMCGKIIGFILLPLLYLTFSKEAIQPPFKQAKAIPFEWISIVLGILLLITSLPWINIMADWNKAIHFPEALQSLEKQIIQTEAMGTAITSLFLEVHSVPDFLLSFCAIAIVPAIGEELIFRGFFQRELQLYTKNIHVSVWIAAFVFSFIHFQFFGFFPRMVLGALFGYMMVWTGSLFVPVIMHFTNNALTLILMLAYKKQYITFDPEKSEQIPLLLIAVSILLSFAILYNRKLNYNRHLSSITHLSHE